MSAGGGGGGYDYMYVCIHTFWNVFLPSVKSRFAKKKPFESLCFLNQLFANSWNSGWNSLHSWQPNRGSSAVRRTRAV